VPLSEHEQRLLEQMERALYAEDPKFASSLQKPLFRRASRGRLIGGVLLALAGIGLLVVGVAVKMPIVGVLGFVAMLGGVVLAFTGSGRETSAPANAEGAAAAPKQSKQQSSGGGFMGRMEERWRHRREDDPSE